MLLTDKTVRAVQAYLDARGQGPTNHVFLYRNRAVCKDLLRGRVKAAGARVGFSVHPHRLRHTYATQLLNAGCPVTSIQRLLGHVRLNSTMRYARAHSTTVATDYFTAMAAVERRMDLGAAADAPVNPDERLQLFDLAQQLAAPALGDDLRLALVAELLCVLAQRAAGTPNVPGESVAPATMSILPAHLADAVPRPVSPS